MIEIFTEYYSYFPQLNKHYDFSILPASTGRLAGYRLWGRISNLIPELKPDIQRTIFDLIRTLRKCFDCSTVIRVDGENAPCPFHGPATFTYKENNKVEIKWIFHKNSTSKVKQGHWLLCPPPPIQQKSNLPWYDYG